MDIKRSYIIVEDQDGNLFRVTQTQEKQNQALRYLASLDKDGALPVLTNNSLNIEAVDAERLESIDKRED